MNICNTLKTLEVLLALLNQFAFGSGWVSLFHFHTASGIVLLRKNIIKTQLKKKDLSFKQDFTPLWEGREHTFWATNRSKSNGTWHISYGFCHNWEPAPSNRQLNLKCKCVLTRKWKKNWCPYKKLQRSMKLF